MKRHLRSEGPEKRCLPHIVLPTASVVRRGETCYNHENKLSGNREFNKEEQTMKMPLKIDITMFAPCGMNCVVCYKHCYHKKPCAGCLNTDTGKPEHCRKCRIKDCIRNSGFSYCFECSDYPCKLITNLEKSYNKRYQASLMKNSEYMRQYGLEAFAQQQEKKYTCSKCGGIISIHDRECSECQEKLKQTTPVLLQ